MSRRRGNGEDSIYKDGDRWRGAIHLGYDEKGRRVRKKVSGRTRNEVADKLRNLRKLVDAGTVPDDRIMVKAFLERWLAHNLPGTVAESTEDDYNDTVRLHLSPALGRKRLAKLTVLDVDKLWQAKREAGYSAKYATKAAECVGTLDRRLHPTDDLDELPITPHARRLMNACLALGALDEFADLRLVQWAHMLGFRGHFSTKSRRYSTTLGALRAARIAYIREQFPGWQPPDDQDPDLILAIGEWRFHSQGLTRGEALVTAALTGRPLPPPSEATIRSAA